MPGRELVERRVREVQSEARGCPDDRDEHPVMAEGEEEPEIRVFEHPADQGAEAEAFDDHEQTELPSTLLLHRFVIPDAAVFHEVHQAHVQHEADDSPEEAPEDHLVLLGAPVTRHHEGSLVEFLVHDVGLHRLRA